MDELLNKRTNDNAVVHLGQGMVHGHIMANKIISEIEAEHVHE